MARNDADPDEGDQGRSALSNAPPGQPSANDCLAALGLARDPAKSSSSPCRQKLAALKPQPTQRWLFLSWRCKQQHRFVDRMKSGGSAGTVPRHSFLPRRRIQHRIRPRLTVKGPLALTEKEPCDFCQHVLFNRRQYRQNLGVKKRISCVSSPNKGGKGARVGSPQRRFCPHCFCPCTS